MKLHASLLAVFALISATWAQSGPCYNQYVSQTMRDFIYVEGYQTNTHFRADPQSGLGNYCYCEGDGRPTPYETRTRIVEASVCQGHKLTKIQDYAIISIQVISVAILQVESLHAPKFCFQSKDIRLGPLCRQHSNYG
jgi:hypothetical protein